MLKPIDVVLQALEVAKECGGELDLDMYAQAHKVLLDATAALHEHDRILFQAEALPTGADYEHVMTSLGLRFEATATIVAENEATK